MKKFLAILAALTFVALPLTAQTQYTAIAGSTFFVVADATLTHYAIVPIPNKSANGNLLITTTGITGSPSGCTLAMYSLGAVSGTTVPAAAEQTPSVTISTGTHTQVVAALSASDITTDQIKMVYYCSTYPTAGTISVSFAPLSTVSVGALTITTPAQVQNYNSGSLTVTPSDGTNAIGALVNYGSTPTAVKALSANAYVTNTVAGNITQVGGLTIGATHPLFAELTDGTAVLSATHPTFATLTDGTNAAGVMATYGTSPGAVYAPGVNAYVTNTVTVSNLTTGDPCQNPQVAKSSVVINTSGAGTTQLVAVSGTKATYVCQVYFVASATTATALFEYGTSTNCTGTTALTGTIVPAVGGIYTFGWGGTIFTAPASNGLCIVNGGTGTQIGFVTYVQQ